MRRYTTLWKLMSEKRQQPETCAVISDNSQGSVAVKKVTAGLAESNTIQ